MHCRTATEHVIACCLRSVDTGASSSFRLTDWDLLELLLY